MKSRGARHNAREFALRMLYSFDVNRKFDDPETEPMTWHNWEGDDSLRIPPPETKFAWGIADGVAEKIDELDAFIQKYTQRWKLHRLAVVDRSILRLAIYEISTNRELETSIIIDEAVELAKCYGDENSPNFINGILDTIAKDIRYTTENGQLTLF